MHTSIHFYAYTHTYTHPFELLACIHYLTHICVHGQVGGVDVTDSGTLKKELFADADHVREESGLATLIVLFVGHWRVWCG